MCWGSELKFIASTSTRRVMPSSGEKPLVLHGNAAAPELQHHVTQLQVLFLRQRVADERIFRSRRRTQSRRYRGLRSDVSPER